MVPSAHLVHESSAAAVTSAAASARAGAAVGTFQLAAAGALAWSKHLIDAHQDDDQVLQLAIFTVRPQVGPVQGDVLVFPGMNGLPRQVAGLDAADYPDRAIGLRLAEAGFAAHVVDYAPGVANLTRSAALLALAQRRSDTPLPAGPAIAETAARWLNTSAACTSGRRAVLGHSLGAFLAALAVHDFIGPCDAVLASGVVPLAWLFETAGKASPLHQLPPLYAAGASFGSLLAGPNLGRVQVQFGTADAVFGQAALSAGADEVAQKLGPQAVVRELAMGHGTNAQAAIEFLKEGARA